MTNKVAKPVEDVVTKLARTAGMLEIDRICWPEGQFVLSQGIVGPPILAAHRQAVVVRVESFFARNLRP